MKTEKSKLRVTLGNKLHYRETINTMILKWIKGIFKRNKIKIFFVFSEFFSININSELFGTGLYKNYFNHTKIFVLRLFKMATNKNEYSRLEQRSVIKFLMADKCKPCEIYWRICNVYEEACFNKKIFINRVCHNKPESKRQFMKWEHMTLW